MKGICTYLLLTFLLTFGSCYLQLVMKMQELQNSICFTVGKPEDTNAISATPAIALILQVSYPQSIAEAGQVILKDLAIGQHNLSYKYSVTNMTHDLFVHLDGEKQNFLKSDVPKWYSVSTFQDVAVMIQGNIRIYYCQADTVKQGKSSKDKASQSHRSNSPLKSDLHEEEFETRTTTVRAAMKIKTLKSDSEKVKTEKKDDQTSKILLEVEEQVETLQEYNNNNIGWTNNENDTVTNMPAEGSSQCLEGDCSNSSAGRNYTIAYILVGILAGLAFFALIISLVFHKKKKKYLRTVAIPPTNRMRILYETSNLAGDPEAIVEKLTTDIRGSKTLEEEMVPLGSNGDSLNGIYEVAHQAQQYI